MAWVRRGVVVLLGVVLVADALASGHLPVLQFTVGLIMIGLVPLESVVDILTRSPSDEGRIERLREVMGDTDEEEP